MKIKRKIVLIDEDKCDGCGACIPNCAEGALRIVDGKARLVADKYCDGLGACLGHCPQDAIRIIEREAEEFDEQAVEELLAGQKAGEAGKDEPMACGCPSSMTRTLKPAFKPGPTPPRPGGGSALGHWPVQIRLVNPESSFLKGADLLVAADCAPVACPDFHSRFLPGKVVLIGCPKFDDAEEYVRRFAAIFAASDVKSATVLEMVVPCCKGLHRIVAEGAKRAGKAVPITRVEVALEGGTRPVQAEPALV